MSNKKAYIRKINFSVHDHDADINGINYYLSGEQNSLDDVICGKYFKTIEEAKIFADLNGYNAIDCTKNMIFCVEQKKIFKKDI